MFRHYDADIGVLAVSWDFTPGKKAIVELSRNKK